MGVFGPERLLTNSKWLKKGDFEGKGPTVLHSLRSGQRSKIIQPITSALATLHVLEIGHSFGEMSN